VYIIRPSAAAQVGLSMEGSLKFELMLTKRAKAYSSFCSQSVSHFVATFTGVLLFDAKCPGFLESRKSRLRLLTT